MSSHSVSPAFVSAADGARLIGISRSGFYAFVKQGALPGPIHLGGRALWEVSKLLEALKQCPQNHLQRTI